MGVGHKVGDFKIPSLCVRQQDLGESGILECVELGRI